VLCHVVPMIMGVSVYVSTLTSMAIAVDRYFAIVHPLRSRLTSRGCLIVIAAVWAASVAVTLPLAIHQNLNVNELNGTVVRTCEEDWPNPDARRLFTVGRSVAQSSTFKNQTAMRKIKSIESADSDIPTVNE